MLDLSSRNPYICTVIKNGTNEQAPPRKHRLVTADLAIWALPGNARHAQATIVRARHRSARCGNMGQRQATIVRGRHAPATPGTRRHELAMSERLHRACVYCVRCVYFDYFRAARLTHSSSIRPHVSNSEPWSPVSQPTLGSRPVFRQNSRSNRMPARIIR